MSKHLKQCENCLWWSPITVDETCGACLKNFAEYAQDYTDADETCKDWLPKEEEQK